MNCKIEKSNLRGTIICPSNKSYTHRGLFLATLTNGTSIIRNALQSKDTKATENACRTFGSQISIRRNEYTVHGFLENKRIPEIIDAENSGTTIRISTAIASLFDKKITLTGDDSLQNRPMQPLLSVLEELGAECSSNAGKPPITIKGPIKGGEIKIPGNISSQFVSSLFIVAPMTEKGIIINIDGELVSKPYIDATISSMKKFGANVAITESYKKYSIISQSYKPTTFPVPSDFSSLGLLLSASVLLGDELTIEIEPSDLPQGDKAILDFLKQLGVKVTLEKGNISTHSPNILIGGKFDLSNNPDLLPPLSILALKSSKPIELYNVKHARFKETDRISILSKELAKLGIGIEEKEDGLFLHPPNSTKGAHLESHNDHRLFMAFCIAGMYLGNCTVSDPESTEISYPNFISDIKNVGGQIFPNI